MTDVAAVAPTGQALSAFAVGIEGVLDALLPTAEGPASRLYEAMRYSALAGGKYIRPYIVSASAGMFDVPKMQRLRTGAAVEMIHVYSLIHDDLPAMDDDDLRRGRPSCHRAFDEATAILAGDALLTLGFETVADEKTHPDPAVRSALVGGLARAAGGGGMVGGQMIDLESEHVTLGVDKISQLERMKTGALIGFSASAGAVLGSAGEAARIALEAFGTDLGLAFQITDDLLDVEGDETDLGKSVGKDAAAGKATFVSTLGVDGARREARKVADSAMSRLDPFGVRADDLRSVAEFVLTRTR